MFSSSSTITGMLMPEPDFSSERSVILCLKHSCLLFNTGRERWLLLCVASLIFSSSTYFSLGSNRRRDCCNTAWQLTAHITVLCCQPRLLFINIFLPWQQTHWFTHCSIPEVKDDLFLCRTHQIFQQMCKNQVETVLMNVVAANETFWLDPTGTQKVKKVPKIGSLSPFAHSAVLDEYGFLFPPPPGMPKRPHLPTFCYH